MTARTPAEVEAAARAAFARIWGGPDTWATISEELRDGWRDSCRTALAAADAARAPQVLVHALPADDGSLSCCGRKFNEVPGDRLALYPEFVTCPPAEETRWSCGRCDSFAARGFDDGQIPEHHRTCRHAGVGPGPQGDALAAVLDECRRREALAVALGDYTLGVFTTEEIERTITAAGVTPPTTTRSDLTGLGAREAGHTVYPATDARSADQDVTG